VRGYEPTAEQEGARLVSEGLDVDRGAMREGPRAPRGVDAADEAADPFEDALAVELRRATAAAREDGEAEVLELVQRAAGERGGCDERHFRCGELVREGVLLEDLRIAPAPGPVELRDHRRGFLDAD